MRNESRCGRVHALVAQEDYTSWIHGHHIETRDTLEKNDLVAEVSSSESQAWNHPHRELRRVGDDVSRPSMT